MGYEAMNTLQQTPQVGMPLSQALALLAIALVSASGSSEAPDTAEAGEPAFLSDPKLTMSARQLALNKVSLLVLPVSLPTCVSLPGIL